MQNWKVIIVLFISFLLVLCGCSPSAPPPTPAPTIPPVLEKPPLGDFPPIMEGTTSVQPYGNETYWSYSDKVRLSKGQVVDIMVQTDRPICCLAQNPSELFFSLKQEGTAGHASTSYDLNAPMSYGQSPDISGSRWGYYGKPLYQNKRTQTGHEVIYTTVYRLIVPEKKSNVTSYYFLVFINYDPSNTVEVTYKIYDIGALDYDEYMDYVLS